VHLEQVDSDKPFILPEHMARFRFLNQHKTPNNPDALPIGFTRHGKVPRLSTADLGCIRFWFAGEPGIV
jgi:hypothetical protein